MKNLLRTQKGFTLIEILIVIGIIAILAAIVIIAINPAKQFAQARNTQRQSNVNAILNAVGQRMADNQGLFRKAADTTCIESMDIPDTPTLIGSAVGEVNLRPCLVPTYISELPVDPSIGVPFAGASYATKYEISRDPTTGRITVDAPEALNESSIPGTPAVSVTR